MKLVKVLLTCIASCGIGLMIMLCFSGTACAAEPIYTKSDLVTQETEYVTIRGQQSASASIMVCGYIVSQDSVPVGAAPKAKTQKISFAPTALPQTGDGSPLELSLILDLVILLLMSILLYWWYLTSKDEKDDRIRSTCRSEKA